MISSKVKPNTDWLDAARTVAILGVVAVHANQYLQMLLSMWGYPSWGLLDYSLSLGRYGVELFFFVSGWLLAEIYGENFENRKYFVRRIARIWPLWIIFAGIGILELKINNSGQWKEVIATTELSAFVIFLITITFTGWLFPYIWNTTIPGGWSIQVEVGHYLVFPLIRKLRIPGLINLSAILALMALIIQELASQPGDSLAINFAKYIYRYGILVTVQFFLIGIVSYKFKESYVSNSSTIKIELTHSKNTSKLILTLALFLFSGLAVPFGSAIDALGYLVIAIPASIIISQSKFRNLATWIGKRSYFIYFAHFYVLRLVMEWLESFKPSIEHSPKIIYLNSYVFLFLTTLFITMALAEISFRFIESPVMNFARKL